MIAWRVHGVCHGCSHQRTAWLSRRLRRVRRKGGKRFVTAALRLHATRMKTRVGHAPPPAPNDLASRALGEHVSGGCRELWVMSHPSKPYQVRCFVSANGRELCVVIGTCTEVIREPLSTTDAVSVRADRFQGQLRAMGWR